MLRLGPELTAAVIVESDAAADAAAADAAAGVVDVEAGEDVVGALRRFYLETREFGVNARLRREAAKLRLFARKMREHVAREEQKQRQRKKQQQKEKVKKEKEGAPRKEEEKKTKKKKRLGTDAVEGASKKKKKL